MGNNTMQSILDRRSIRSYTAEPVTDEQVAILEKAVLASPSAVNYQPWHITFVRDQALLEEIKQTAVTELKRDSKLDIFFSAPLVVFIAADTTRKWGVLDSGIAVQTLALAAQGMGLGSVIVGMVDAAFDAPKADELSKRLGFPENHRFAISIAIGSPSAGKSAHENQPDRITRIDG